MRCLAGDVGGTNSRLALYENGELLAQHWAKNSEYVELETILAEFIADHGRPDATCLGVAGPVRDGHVLMTNLGWETNASDLEAVTGSPVRLINDFHAQALAMPYLHSEDYVSLDEIGVGETSTIAVLGPGTGFGQGIAIKVGAQWTAIPGEGSHGRFAPQNKRQIGLLEGLMERWPEHVSVERIVSGPGLVNVYTYLRGDDAPHPDMDHTDPAAVITREALANGCKYCVEALEIMVDVLADEAATVALKCLPDVLYLSGGIPPRIVPMLKTRFRRMFENKGRYRYVMETIPVRIVTHSAPGLVGARVAAEYMTQR